MSDNVITLTGANFDETLKQDTPILVDFWATWCGPCKMMSPIFDKVATDTSDIRFGKIDVDEESDLAQKYGVMSIPTLILFKGGKEVAKSVGYKNEQQLKNFINDNK